MTKSEEASGFFDDGLVFVFKDEAGELKGVKPMHIHLEIQTGTQELETCDLRLYSVEESEMTEKQKTIKTVCATSRFSTGGGPDIESEGSNPTHEEGSPDRADGAMRMLQEEDSENSDDGVDGDDGEPTFSSDSEIPTG